jgi:hypothetical protein
MLNNSLGGLGIRVSNTYIIGVSWLFFEPNF